MESQQIERAQRGSWDPNWNVPKLKDVSPFDDVMEEIQVLQDLRIEPRHTTLRSRGIFDEKDVGYDVVNLNTLQFSSAGQVLVPGQGVLEMTPWARQQLGAEIGVRWDKFFRDMAPDQIQTAVTNHLSARGYDTLKKVIGRRHRKGNEKASSVGSLRAFVSPSYAEITDVQLMDGIRKSISPSQLNEMGFFKFTTTDRGTFLSLVCKEPVNLLGDRGVDEIAYYGTQIRNSEVGAYSIIGDGYLLRLVCSNGMMVGFTEDRWLYRRHHHIDSTLLNALLEKLFVQMIANKDNIVKSNRILESTVIENPNKEIRAFLKKHHRPKVEQDSAVKAMYEDLGVPQPEDDEDAKPRTAYNVMQGIARLGMVSRNAPERQHEIEMIAGDYMKTILKRAA